MPKERHSEYVSEALDSVRPLGRGLRPLASQLREAEALGVPFGDVRGRTRFQTYCLLLRRMSRRLGALGYPRMPHPELPPLGLPEIHADERHEMLGALRESTVGLRERQRPSPLMLQYALDLGLTEEEIAGETRGELSALLETRYRDIVVDATAAMRKIPREDVDEALREEGRVTCEDAEALASAQFDGWTAAYVDGGKERTGRVRGVELNVVSAFGPGAPIGMQVLSVDAPPFMDFGPGFLRALPVRGSMIRLLTPPKDAHG